MKTVKVFKFGGASVKDAEAIKNVANILGLYKQDNILVVISAIGKTTNLLEDLINAYWKNDDSKFSIFESFCAKLAFWRLQFFFLLYIIMSF